MDFANEHNVVGYIPELSKMIAAFCGLLMLPVLRLVSKPQLRLLTDEWVSEHLKPLTLTTSQILSLEGSKSVEEALEILSTYRYHNADDGMRSILEVLDDDSIDSIHQLHLPNILEILSRHGGSMEFADRLDRIYQKKAFKNLNEGQMKLLEESDVRNAIYLLGGYQYLNANEVAGRLLRIITNWWKVDTKVTARIILILEQLIKNGAQFALLPKLNPEKLCCLVRSLENWDSKSRLGISLANLIIAGLPTDDECGVARGNIMRSLNAANLATYLQNDAQFRYYIGSGLFVDPFSHKWNILLDTFGCQAVDSKGRTMAMKILHGAHGPTQYSLSQIMKHRTYDPSLMKHADTEGHTILRTAVSFDRVDWKLFHQLVKAGADPFHQVAASSNESYAMMAVRWAKKPIKIVTLLLEGTHKLNLQDANGWTLMHHLTRNKAADVKCFELFLEAGADPDIHTDEIYSVRHVLHQSGFEIVGCRLRR